MDWENISNWILSAGEQYGVNPVIFALLYFGTIPFSLLSFAWMVKNIRRGKPIFLPVFCAFLCFIGTYVYLFISGKNIPFWVYLIILSMMTYGGWIFWKKLEAIERAS